MLNFEIKIRLVRKATLRKGNFVDFKLEHWQIILKSEEIGPCNKGQKDPELT